MENVQLYRGDCRDVLKRIEPGSVDAVVTDPPGGIAFMGKEWDSFGGRANPDAQRDRDTPYRGPGKGAQPFGYSGSAMPTKGERQAFVAFLSCAMTEVCRVLKPGAFGLVWALPRTSHWTAIALEDAGFQIRDKICHLFGTGFPKSKSCLKPGYEDWYLIRKPGPMQPLQIDECRIAGAVPQVTQGVERRGVNGDAIYGAGHGMRRVPQLSNPHLAGRWPANVVLSHHPDCMCVGTKRVKAAVNNGSKSKPSVHTYGDYSGDVADFGH